MTVCAKSRKLYRLLEHTCLDGRELISDQRNGRTCAFWQIDYPLQCFRLYKGSLVLLVKDRGCSSVLNRHWDRARLRYQAPSVSR